jgi:hypothetical protein
MTGLVDTNRLTFVSIEPGFLQRLKFKPNLLQSLIEDEIITHLQPEIHIM